MHAPISEQRTGLVMCWQILMHVLQLHLAACGCFAWSPVVLQSGGVSNEYVFSSWDTFIDSLHNGHNHQHSENCNHVREKHLDHWDYQHDGHDHHMQGTHAHEAKLKVHKNHSHIHGNGCGHQTRVHAGRLEFNHDGHWHHTHGTHTHESHS